MSKIKNYWYSLRFRFFISAGLLLMLVLSGALSAYKNIQNLRYGITENLQTHRELNETTRKIRLYLLNNSIHIQAYLLDPSIKRHRSMAFNSIEKANDLVNNMREQLEKIPGTEQEKIELVRAHLSQLTNKTHHLFEVRDNASRQFPSLSVGNDIMQPSRNALNNAIALALNEMNNEEVLKEAPSVYRELVDIRHLWSQLLSNFRLYLANRVGSFNEEALPVQEDAIDTMYSELKHKIVLLNQYNDKNIIGFQAGIALEDMLGHLENWYSGFVKVKEIHNAAGWRVDSKIMKEDIVPLLETVSRLLVDIEGKIGLATANDVERLSAASQRQATVLTWGAAAILLLMALVFWSINRMVFRPLAMVVKALKAEASGMETVLLPEARSQETAALVESFNYMAKQVRKRQSDLEYQALHDALTGLPNRTLLQERLTHDIQMADQENTHVSLLILDIDRFKEVNDTLGHHVGDRLLIQTGRRIQTLIRDVDTVARLGGDEFAVVLTNSGQNRAISVASKIIAAMEKTLVVDEFELYVSPSIGAAIYPVHGDDAATLLQHADIAMYNAKNNQIGYSVYAPDEDDYSLMRLEMINDLRDAIENNQLDICFHPIIDLQNDKPCGVECLLRWYHPRFGMISPQQVIELAEHTGLIHPLTFWALRNALEKSQELVKSGYHLSLSVNISAHNLRDVEFFDKVKVLIDEYSVGGDLLVFEITESAMMANPLRAAELLAQLDKIGIELSVDDYGTGFSSLAYLKQLPVDELKIDRSFVSGMEHHDSDITIVRSTIDLAHNLGLKVVAEGAENEKTIEQLRAWGCDRVQGYYYTRPLPMSELQLWLDSYHPSGQNLLL